jgi:hypothetical protein
MAVVGIERDLRRRRIHTIRYPRTVMNVNNPNRLPRLTMGFGLRPGHWATSPHVMMYFVFAHRRCAVAALHISVP